MSKEGVMKTFTLHVDFDGRREDGEMSDGKKVLATDEDDAYKKFNEEFPCGWNLEHFGAGWRIVDEDEEEEGGE